MMDVAEPAASTQAGPDRAELFDVTIVHDLVAYHRWANTQIIEACRRVRSERITGKPSGGGVSLGEMLLGLVGAEGGYLRAMAGWSPPDQLRVQPEMEFPGLDWISERMRIAGRELELATRRDGREIVNRDDGPAVQAWIPLVGALVRAIEQRAEIAAALAELDASPGDLSVWAYGIDRQSE